eukprot:gene12223-20416_t
MAARSPIKRDSKSLEKASPVSDSRKPAGNGIYKLAMELHSQNEYQRCISALEQ